MVYMNDNARKSMARRILEDDSSFNIFSYDELKEFYGAKKDEVVPNTLCCARNEARIILGEPEASEASRNSLERWN